MTTDDERLVREYFVAWWEWVRTAAAAGGIRRPEWAAREPAPPVAALQVAALAHPNARVRRECLAVLDHHANDASTAVFVAALRDPVPRVRSFAVHGLACERCRQAELCVADVVPTLAEILEHDTSAKVRGAVVFILDRLAERSVAAAAALGRAAAVDADEYVRRAALAAVDGRHRDVRSRKALRRRARSAQAVDVRPLLGVGFGGEERVEDL